MDSGPLFFCLEHGLSEEENLEVHWFQTAETRMSQDAPMAGAVASMQNKAVWITAHTTEREGLSQEPLQCYIFTYKVAICCCIIVQNIVCVT